MSIETRPEYQAALIQLEADGHELREQQRESYRQRIMGFIACAYPWPKPENETVNIGYDDEQIS